MSNPAKAPRRNFCGRTRREFLWETGGGFTGVALASMLGNDGFLANQSLAADGTSRFVNPLAPKDPHFTPKAKRCIFLFMYGGPSQIDTFDYKPNMKGMDNKIVDVKTFGRGGHRNQGRIVEPRWDFKQYGECGQWVSSLFPHLATCVDDIAFLHSMTADSPIHGSAMLMMNSGSLVSGKPTLGSWINYGLGTVNQNLPSFMVLAPAAPYAGAQTWGSDFLPGCHQGTHVIPGREPVANIKPRVASRDLQEMELNLRSRLNRVHQARRTSDLAIDARIRSFETAFGMQRAAPEAFDVTDESERTLEMYGMKRDETSGFGWQCLMARRLSERGVRFIELIDVGSNNNWDSHGNMGDHERLARHIDKPIAGLLTDLKQRGMLDRTLVVWTSEFGRTPFNTSANHAGREHHNFCFTSWMAGGGVKGGMVHGQSDEHGILTTQDAVHTHDLHATILHVLGMDHERLTYRHAGRDFRLTDVSGRVVQEILA